MGGGPSTPLRRVDPSIRAAVFGGAPPSLEAAAKYILDGRARDIVILAGAGISVSAGIPDFRTPGTGLYSRLGEYGLPRPEAVFDLEFFARNPRPFFHLARTLMPGTYAPTRTHAFIRLLADKGIVRRVYTQNIDTLERLAGVPDAVMVEAHGSFHTATCRQCLRKYDLAWLRREILDGPATSVEDVRIPMCERCGGIVKPDITFFGEQLPARFHACLKPDMVKCDMLLVMGTSLKVGPVNSIPALVPLSAPRVLLNREAVLLSEPADEDEDEDSDREGGGQREEPGSSDGLSRADEVMDAQGGFMFNCRGNYRDVLWEGDTDAGVDALAAALGWTSELDAVHARILAQFAETAAAAHPSTTTAVADVPPPVRDAFAASSPVSPAAVVAAAAEERRRLDTVTATLAAAAAASSEAAAKCAAEVDAAGLNVLEQALKDLEIDDGGGATESKTH